MKATPDEHTHDVNTAVFPRGHNQHRKGLDKCKKCVVESFIAYESLLQLAVTFTACLSQSSAILVHSWGLSFSILTRFAQRCGSLEPSRGGMLEVIGAVGFRSGLC